MNSLQRAAFLNQPSRGGYSGPTSQSLSRDLYPFKTSLILSAKRQPREKQTPEPSILKPEPVETNYQKTSQRHHPTNNCQIPLEELAALEKNPES